MDVPRSFAWRPKTTFILLGGFVVVLIALVAAFAANTFKPTVTVQLGASYYSLLLADTEAKRAKGLSGVTELPVNGGLLMVFDTDSQWGIWMKDMQIPIDILWLDKNQKVVYIEQNVRPEVGTSKTFVPKQPARYVIELPAGGVSKAGIKVGQNAQFSLGGE